MRTNNAQIVCYFDGIRIGSCGIVNIGVDHHMNRIADKTYSRIGSLFRGFVSRNLHFLKQAHFTYIRPLSDYERSVWSLHLSNYSYLIMRTIVHHTSKYE